MSKFSERCKFYIQSQGVTLYKCSQKSGIERTTLHRMVTGKRLPSMEALDTFCDYLRLDNSSRDELKELYYEEKVGTARYQNRKFIRVFLEYLTDMELSSAMDEHVLFNGSYHFEMPSHQADVTSSPVKTTSALQTQTLVHQLLSYTFSQKIERTIYTNLPHTFGNFFDNIRTLFFAHSEANVTLNHLFTFLSSPEHSTHVNHNLEILFHVLPLALSPYKDYRPYYSYSNCIINDIDFVLWSYFIVSDDYALAISSDMATAILHFDPNIITAYQERATQIKERMSPLVNPSTVFGQVCDQYHHFNNKLGAPIFTVEFTPCVSYMFSPDNIAELMKTLPMDLIEKTDKNILDDIFNTIINSAQKNTTHIFTRRGIEYFIKTGKLPGQGACYLPAFSAEDRQKAIKSFLGYVKQAETAFICLKTEFTAPQNIYIELYENNIILFLRFLPDTDMRFCYIQESSLYDAFYDFMDSLREAGLAMDNEELIAYLNSYLVCDK